MDTFNAAVMSPILNVFFYVPDLFKVVTNTAQNFANVVAAIPDAVITPALTLAYPLLSGANAIAEVARAVLDAAKVGDFAGVTNALINAPANIVDGVLNDAGKILGLFPTPGLLTPYDPVMGFLGSGPIAMLLQARQVFADALKPITGAPAASAAAVSSPSAAAVATSGGDVVNSTPTASSNDVPPSPRATAQASRSAGVVEPGDGSGNVAGANHGSASGESGTSDTSAHSNSASAASGTGGTKSRANTGAGAKSGAGHRSAAS